MIVVILDGMIEWVNIKDLDVSGYREEELIGHSIYEFIFHEDIEQIKINHTHRLSGEKVQQPSKVRILCKDGTIKSVVVRGVATSWHGQTGLMLFFTDITARIQSHLEVKENNSLYYHVLEDMGDGLWDWCIPLKLKYFSQRFFKILGYERDEFPSTFEAWCSLLHPDERDAVIADLQNQIQKYRDIISIEYRIKTKDGNWKWILARGKVIDRDTHGDAIRAVGINTDITRWKISEESQNEIIKKFHLLTSIIRHDICNQISALQARQDLAYESSDLQHLYDHLHSSKEICENIETILEFTGDYEILGTSSSRWEPLHPIIESAKDEIFFGEVTIDNLVPLDLEIYVDPIIRKVFTSLMDNSLRHGENLTFIRISAQFLERTMVIFVEDDGVGIPKSDKDLIFEYGYGNHTGMGLFLTSEILAITGISIRETGVEGKGARFEIIIPLGKYRFIQGRGEKKSHISVYSKA